MRKVLCLATLLLLTAFAFAQANNSTEQSGTMGQSSSTAQSGSMGQSGSASGDEQQLLDIEQQWADAMTSGDAAAIQRIEADSYVLTEGDGTKMTKQDDVNGLKSGDVKYQSAKVSDLKANVNGDTGTVTGRIALKGTDKGKDISGTYEFTDTFAKKDGTWQAVSTKSQKVADSAMKD
jgi:ketosteroid isomerase-like protein